MGAGEAVDVVVVGGGVVGLAVACALADDGADVRCLEAGVAGRGQSAGMTRIFRYTHGAPELVAQAVEARGAWRAWEERLGRRLVGDEGAVLVTDEAEDHVARLRSAGVEAEVRPASEIEEVLPIAAPHPGAMVVEPGGAIRSRRTLDALAGWLGARLVSARVLALWPGADEVTVQATEGLWRAPQVVVCAGAATTRIARAHGVEIPVDHAITLRAAFAVRDDRAGGPLPCLRDHTAAFGEQTYGLAVGTTGRYAVGLANYATVPPETGVPVGGDPPEVMLDRLRRYLRRALPGLEPEPLFVRTCVSENPAWGPEGWRTWRAGRITFVAGAQLFKFAPLIGRQVARAVATDRPPPDRERGAV